MSELIETRNARIRSTMLGLEDHGILTAWIQLEYAGSGQGFGGYSFASSSWTSEACAVFVWRVLQVVGVEKWEDLKGKTVRVRCDHGKVHALGNIIDDRWFDPAEEFKALSTVRSLERAS